MKTTGETENQSTQDLLKEAEEAGLINVSNNDKNENLDIIEI